MVLMYVRLKAYSTNFTVLLLLIGRSESIFCFVLCYPIVSLVYDLR